MNSVKISLAEELAPLQSQIAQAREKIGRLEGEMRSVQAEIDSFSGDKRRFDALRDVCAALDALAELGAGSLFWEDLRGGNDAASHLNQMRDRIAGFEAEIREMQERHAGLSAEIRKQQTRLNFLHEEVRQAYAREERRNEELLIERPISPTPDRVVLMPWNSRDEDHKRFRRALLVALSFCIVFGVLVPLWKLPKPDRSAPVAVPQRLVSLAAKEPPRPEPVPERLKEEKKPEKSADEAKENRPVPSAAETQAARKKAVSTGVLAFKESFSDLMDETSVAGLGAQARLAGEARPGAQPGTTAGRGGGRSIIALQSAAGTSGGIGNAGVSRAIGSGSGNRLGSVGFTRVESTVAGLTEEARPVSTGPGPARTDEEIQIVFDRYKATLYRMYNAELRRNPTLRGKIILRITIEPGGEVSSCTVQSSDLASPPLVAQIVERVKKFNFGPKEKVSRTTILYPIDFLPGG